MEKKKLPAIVLEDAGMVMEEVTEQLKPLFRMSTEERRAFNTFFGTLTALTLAICDYLPPEQQDEILAACGTWLDIGMLLGKSPQILQGILDRVKPKMEPIEIPDWLGDRYTRASEQEEG